MSFKLTSKGKLAEELQRRVNEFAGRKSAVAIEAEGMDWWYFQEFGTATHAERGSPNPSGYEIKPVNGGSIRLPDIGAGPGDVRKVGPPVTDVHPGVEPKHMVTRVLDEIRADVSARVVSAMQEGNYTFSPIQNSLIDSMTSAKDTIRDSFAEQLEGIRTDPIGQKLEGSAADEFENRAEVVDLSH